jgi:hypothetical protein
MAKKKGGLMGGWTSQQVAMRDMVLDWLAADGLRCTYQALAWILGRSENYRNAMWGAGCRDRYNAIVVAKRTGLPTWYAPEAWRQIKGFRSQPVFVPGPAFKAWLDRKMAAYSPEAA